MNAFRTIFRTNCLYGKNLFKFIVSYLFKNIIQWTSQTNVTSPDAQSSMQEGLRRLGLHVGGGGKYLYLFLNNKGDTRIQ